MAHNLVSAWQRMLFPRRSAFHPPTDGQAAIHRYDPIDNFAAWARCRDRAQFHLGRARRAKDRGHYHEAAREIERALRYDDTSEAYFQVLGQRYGRRAMRKCRRHLSLLNDAGGRKPHVRRQRCSGTFQGD